MTDEQAYTREDIDAWVASFLDTEDGLDPATSLQDDLGVWGDDLDELLGAYSDRFNVDMSKYLWYFHNREEGVSFAKALCGGGSPDIPRIPITLAMLYDYANSGTWSVEYPAHDAPPQRRDALVNRVVAAVIALGVVAYVAWRLLK